MSSNKIISGTADDIDKLKGLKVLHFRILETMYFNGKTKITKWEALYEQ